MRRCVFRENSIGILVWQRSIAALVLTIGTALLIILSNPQFNPTLAQTLETGVLQETRFLSFQTTPPKPHPLPPTLVQWKDRTNSGDYFSQVTPIANGYLVWSQFPVRVYIESPKAIGSQQAEAWVNSVSQAVQEWNVYLPLTVVEKSEEANISIIRKAPPLQILPDSKIFRARSAQTTYGLYTSKNNLLSHRFTILLSPSQTGQYLLAAARHEFGHALGIWGHSPLQTDALYFSQVRNPPPISPRDVNTLKRVYEQRTRLGWPSKLSL